MHLLFLALFLLLLFIVSTIANIVSLLFNTEYEQNNNNDNKNIAYAHFVTDTDKGNAVIKKIDNKYQVAFLPYPTLPVINDNSTKLNFSVMENNTDVFGVFVSLVIKDKNTDKIVEQIPYKFHEFGDVTFPYTFQNVSDYTVTLESRINGDPKYQSEPLKASFDISVQDPSSNISSNFVKAMVYYVNPAAAGILGILIYSQLKKKRRKE
jgi:uncharacterized protein YpmS